MTKKSLYHKNKFHHFDTVSTNDTTVIDYTNSTDTNSTTNETVTATATTSDDDSGFFIRKKDEIICFFAVFA